jgi:hypothetical protein
MNDFVFINKTITIYIILLFNEHIFLTFNHNNFNFLINNFKFKFITI